MMGSLASVPLPDFDGPPPDWSRGAWYHPLQRTLLERHRIEVPIMVFPSLPGQLVRVAAAAYNAEDQFARLAAALTRELGSG